MSDIKHSQGDKKGSFDWVKDGKVSASMVYSKAGTDRIIIEHTEVDDELRGEGVGKKLLLELVQFARENNLKVVPLCPFANSVFKKNKELQDVL